MSNPLAGIRGRVTLTVFAVSAVVFSLLGTLGFLLLSRSGHDAIEERITVVLDEFESGLRSGSGAVRLSTADGVVAVAVVPDAVSPETAGEVQVVRMVDLDGTQVALVGTSSEARLTDSMRSLHRALWIAIPLASLLCAVMAGVATGRALRPVGAISDLAASIGASTDGARVPVPETGDEIERLATTVNGMLDRLDEGRAAQRQFTSDAAHELRTPLMALQGELELVRGGHATVDEAMLDRLDVLCGRLGARIDDLVLLSTLDEGRPLAQSPTDLLDVVRDEVAVVAPDATVDGEPVVVDADRELVARAVRNLLANARRHATHTVAVTVAVDESRAWIHVDDDGPGLDAERGAEVFRRFSRLDESRAADRGGSGLGLAIVASVASAHGGDVAAAASPLGGARLSLWLPR